MELKLAENALIDKVTIDLSEHFPEEEAKQYIKLRAMNVQEMLPFTRHQAALQNEGAAQADAIERVTTYLIEAMPSLIIEHSFTVDGKPADPKQVTAMLAGNQALFMEIMNAYVNAQSFRQGKNTG